MRVPKLFKSVRHSLFGLNIIFLLSGFLLLIIGSIVLSIYSDYEGFVTDRFSKIPTFVIATAVIIFFISALGFYGAISQQFYFIAGYLILLVAILIFEIVICTLGYSLYNDALSEIRTTMASNIYLYLTRIDVAKMWDDLQMSYKCCGIVGRNDWGLSMVPVSCCHIDYGTLSPFTCNSDIIYKTGCASILGDWLSFYAYIIGVVGLSLTVIQVFLVVTTGWLTWRSRFEEVELES